MLSAQDHRSRHEFEKEPLRRIFMAVAVAWPVGGSEASIPSLMLCASKNRKKDRPKEKHPGPTEPPISSSRYAPCFVLCAPVDAESAGWQRQRFAHRCQGCRLGRVHVVFWVLEPLLLPSVLLSNGFCAYGGHLSYCPNLNLYLHLN